MFSIITASFNSGDQIRKTYDSLLKQDKKLFEWIIVDGGSDERSQQVIDSIVAEHKVEIRFISEPDRGPFDAFNKGLRLAKCEWIGFLGCGDEYYPDILRLVSDHIQNERNIDVVYGLVDFVRHDGAHYWFATDERFLDEGRMMHHASMFIRKQVYSAVGGFSTHYKTGSDLDTVIRIRQNNYKFSFCPYIMTRFYDGGLSTIRNLPTEERIRIMYENNLIGRRQKLKLVSVMKVKKILYDKILKW